MPLKFKDYLFDKSTYKGGLTKAELAGLDKKIYKLNSNENQIGSSPLAIKALQDHLSTLSEYPIRTDDKFREALSSFYKGELSKDHFLVGNSGSAILDFIIRGFMDEGTECIYSNPAFAPYAMFPEKYGAKSIDIPLIGDNFALDVNGIISAINEKTRLIFITSPNNPTGSYLPKSQVDELVHRMPDDVILVYDEVYYQYADASDFTRAYPYVQAGKNVIGVNSFSKAYGLAGLRIGYSYSTPEIANYLRQMWLPFMINTLSMEAAIAALKDDDFIKNTVDLVRTEKQFLYNAFDDLGLKYWPTQANFILTKPKGDPAPLIDFLQNEGVLVRDVAGFGAPGCVRITIGNREANLELIKGLSAFLKK